eukprot:1158140-Pelagomonas_calceolata.AAC.9
MGSGQLPHQPNRCPVLSWVLLDSEGRVSGVRVEVTQLADVEGKGRVAVATGEALDECHWLNKGKL